MDKTEAMKKACEFSRMASKYLTFNNAVLFGSYVNGTPREDSDIDIAFFADTNVNQDYLSLLIQLNKLARIVDCRIEPHIFDVETKNGFGEFVLINGKVIS